MAESPYDPPAARIDPPIPSDQPTMERPKEIILVIWLAVAMFVVGAIGALLTWDYQMSVQSPGQFLLGQVFGVAFAFWIYYKIYQGRNWARILDLVLSLLGWVTLLIPAVNQVWMATPAILKVGSGINLLIQLAILWLLFVSPGRHWFKRTTHDPFA